MRESAVKESNSILAKNLLENKKCENCKFYNNDQCDRTKLVSRIKRTIPDEQTCRFWKTEEEFDGTWYYGYDDFGEDENHNLNKANSRNFRKYQKQTIKTKMKGIY